MARHVSHDVTVLLVESTQDDRAMYAQYLRVCGLTPLEIEPVRARDFFRSRWSATL